MSAQDVDSLVKSWQSGAISHQTLFSNLVSGDVIAQDVSFDDEMERIANMPAHSGLI
jgi:hypothetical protein